MIVIHSFIHAKGSNVRKLVGFVFFSLEFHRTTDASQHTMRTESEDKKCEIKLYLNNTSEEWFVKLDMKTVYTRNFMACYYVRELRKLWHLSSSFWCNKNILISRT